MHLCNDHLPIFNAPTLLFPSGTLHSHGYHTSLQKARTRVGTSATTPHESHFTQAFFEPNACPLVTSPTLVTCHLRPTHKMRSFSPTDYKTIKDARKCKIPSSAGLRRYGPPWPPELTCPTFGIPSHCDTPTRFQKQNCNFCESQSHFDSSPTVTLHRIFLYPPPPYTIRSACRPRRVSVRHPNTTKQPLQLVIPKISLFPKRACKHKKSTIFTTNVGCHSETGLRRIQISNRFRKWTT